MSVSGVRASQRRQPQKARGFAACDATPHGFEQAVGHALRDPPALILGEAAAEEISSSLGGEPAAASSIRAPDRPSKQMTRAPMSAAVRSTISPPSQTAIFDVPPHVDVHHPPAVADRTGHRAGAEAASVVSSPSPALTATNLPACCAKSSPIARAFRRRTATPVRMSAPVSMASGSCPASPY